MDLSNASPSTPAWLDAMQSSFLEHLEVGAREALLNVNLTPMRLRRDIGTLGVSWEVCNGCAFSDFEVLFPTVPWRTGHGQDTRCKAQTRPTIV